jgi:L-ascorbate metabolism protein UlaG (beta-lactamase superfamily)
MCEMKNISIRLIRHATLLLTLGDVNLLIDPMLSAKEALDPVQDCGNNRKIPMTDLPLDAAELTKVLKDVDAVFVTHMHRDHWDITSQKLIANDKRIYCQPADAKKLGEQGFTDVVPVNDSIKFRGLTVYRTKGRHGTGDIGVKMGEVSGFLFSTGGLSVYIAGDTIWCPEVQNALKTFDPNIVVVNAGGARFLTGGPITMTPDDIAHVQDCVPHSKIVAVHMDTVNHCLVTRDDLKNAFAGNHRSALQIPADGETLFYNAASLV